MRGSEQAKAVALALKACAMSAPRPVNTDLARKLHKALATFLRTHYDDVCIEQFTEKTTQDVSSLFPQHQCFVVADVLPQGLASSLSLLACNVNLK